MHIKIGIGSELYVLGTLSFNHSKCEICYHFHHSETSPKKLYDINSNYFVDPPIHITWHRKRVHIRTESGILYFVEYPNGDIFPSNLEVRPLLVEGITLNNTTVLLRREDAFENWKNADEYLQLQLPEVSNFSLVLMLVPFDWTTSNVFLYSHLSGKQNEKVPLWYLRNEKHEIGRINLFDGWDLCILTSPYVRKVQSLSEDFSSGYRVIDFVKPADSLYVLAMQGRYRPTLTNQQLDSLRSVMNAEVDLRIQSLKGD